MRELLQLLAGGLGFLLAGDRYRLGDSHVGTTFGDASITLSSSTMRWRLVRDRSQIFLECQPDDASPTSWYSTDLLVRLLDGRRVDSAELDEQTARWVEESLSDIEEAFSPDRLEETTLGLNELKRTRAQELFG